MIVKIALKNNFYCSYFTFSALSFRRSDLDPQGKEGKSGQFFSTVDSGKSTVTGVLFLCSGPAAK